MTIILLVVQGFLVLYTLMDVAGMFINQQNSEDRCRIHGLDCGDQSVGPAALIGLGGSAVLFILVLVLAIRQMAKHRLAFYIPLLGCIGQVIVLVAILDGATAG